MTHNRRKALAATRRTALLLPLGLLSGCGLWDSWFGSDKPPLPGTRIAVMPPQPGLDLVSSAVRKVVLPPPAPNAEWPQAGGLPSHDMEHPALRDTLARAWSADIGTGSSYRRKITAQPVVAGGRVFAMDSDAVVSAFDAASGRRVWSLDTQDDEDRSTNVGGGISADGGTLYAATGRADLLAIEAATGKVQWRVKLGAPARSAPTIAEGKLFIPTISNQLQARAADDGRRLWAYEAGNAETPMLGLPAPAYTDGLVVAGFGSGDLVGLRASSGVAAWADSLAASRGRTSMADLSAIRGRPIIKEGRVYAIGLGRQLVALDLRSGRRLWEREVASTETPWAAGNWLFVLSDSGQLAAVARDDGSVAWVTQLDRFENMKKQTDPIRWVGPVLAGDRLVVAGTNKFALALSPYTGEIIGKQELPGAAALTPIVADGTLYILTDNATLTAFR
ncbi:outer membrane protein assembly factor BamB family protein [Limobrevibacterium gyesilva]|uniref:PQQ-binding-like beta-propeller repeat protein n=1 Tax=Limobrevibacterium gyesilva TaxID=2991712 RepID=A0AA41YV44_9PROT|nr:PQQ-binding-like beta-propeller repeat protein [Limobrevibacterium gyesilva]MCW3477025.1 PQQ-binding-like beta-propeller repeat protein [Limobrevibacterium gyesilva]